jgi:AcrR family transcriptional regulator
MSLIANSGSESCQRILEAAAAEFAAHGFRGATMSAIAHSAGLNEVTVFRYFPTKQQLYWEAVDFKIRNSGFFEDLLAVVETDGAPVDVMSLLGETVIDAIDREPVTARLLYLGILEKGRERNFIMQKYVIPLIQALTRRVEAWTRSGTIRALDPESVATALLAIFITHCAIRNLLGLAPHRTQSAKEFAEEYAGLCMRGLGVQARSASACD